PGAEAAGGEAATARGPPTRRGARTASPGAGAGDAGRARPRADGPVAGAARRHPRAAARDSLGLSRERLRADRVPLPGRPVAGDARAGLRRPGRDGRRAGAERLLRGDPRPRERVRSRRSMTASAAQAVMPAERTRVVLVDDDDLFRESVSQNLAEAGYDVRGFAEGGRAIEWFGAGGRADLVLLDWKMPEMNGIEVLRRLRQHGYEIPVIFLTGLTDQIYEEAALMSGAVDFVEKSRSFGILLKRIELILAGRKGGGEAERGGDGPQRIGDLELR